MAPKSASDKLRALVREAPDGPWEWTGGYPQRITNAGAILVAETYHDPDSVPHETIVIALTPELAELCADMAEALAIGERQEWHPYERNLADSALARLDDLSSENEA